MPVFFIHKDGTIEELDNDIPTDDIDISPECWTAQGVEVGDCKDFSGKFMFPEKNKDLN